MFIVQENTSSTHSIGHGGDVSEENNGKVTIDSRGNLPGIGHSPVIGVKTNKPQLSNLLKSQGPPASVYSNEQQLSNNQARGHHQYH